MTLIHNEPSPLPSPSVLGEGVGVVRRNRGFAILIAFVFFLAVAPTLPWQEFSSGAENLVVATAMEMRRGGPWLVPTLQGEPRIAKPPLAAWITAGSILPGTMRDIDTRDFRVRQRGFFLLALEARWPALISTCLLLLGVFELGRAIQGSTFGLRACAICASSYFVLRFSRHATTDIQLALWVTWTNVFLARAVLRGKCWSGFIGAGVTLGLAMLSKGPVALVQSVVPMLVYVLATRTSAPRLAPAPTRGPILIGSLLFLITGTWWYILVLANSDNVAQKWFSEVTRIGATDTPASSIFSYLAIVGFVVPWTVFFIVGFVVTIRSFREKSPDLLALCLLVVPLLVMTLAKDRQDRYTLPMLPAAAMVAAIGVGEYLKRWPNPASIDRAVVGLHWLTLAGIAVGLPIVGATPLLKQATGEPWFTRSFAAIEASLAATLILAGLLRHRRSPGALVNTTLIVMLIAQAVAFGGYCSSSSGRSELKKLADTMAAQYPDGSFYNGHPRGKRPPTDLGVYLNRTIRWTSDPSSLRPAEHPLVLFMLQNKGESVPTPPPGWNPVTTSRRDKDWWWAFVLPPS